MKYLAEFNIMDYLNNAIINMDIIPVIRVTRTRAEEHVSPFSAKIENQMCRDYSL